MSGIPVEALADVSHVRTPLRGDFRLFLTGHRADFQLAQLRAPSGTREGGRFITPSTVLHYLYEQIAQINDHRTRTHAQEIAHAWSDGQWHLTADAPGRGRAADSLNVMQRMGILEQRRDFPDGFTRWRIRPTPYGLMHVHPVTSIERAPDEPPAKVGGMEGLRSEEGRPLIEHQVGDVVLFRGEPWLVTGLGGASRRVTLKRQSDGKVQKVSGSFRTDLPAPPPEPETRTTYVPSTMSQLKKGDRFFLNEEEGATEYEVLGLGGRSGRVTYRPVGSETRFKRAGNTNVFIAQERVQPAPGGGDLSGPVNWRMLKTGMQVTDPRGRRGTVIEDGFEALDPARPSVKEGRFVRVRYAQGGVLTLNESYARYRTNDLQNSAWHQGWRTPQVGEFMRAGELQPGEQFTLGGAEYTVQHHDPMQRMTFAVRRGREADGPVPITGETPVTFGWSVTVDLPGVAAADVPSGTPVWYRGERGSIQPGTNVGYPHGANLAFFPEDGFGRSHPIGRQERVMLTGAEDAAAFRSKADADAAIRQILAEAPPVSEKDYRQLGAYVHAGIEDAILRSPELEALRQERLQRLDDANKAEQEYRLLVNRRAGLYGDPAQREEWVRLGEEIQAAYTRHRAYRDEALKVERRMTNARQEIMVAYMEQYREFGTFSPNIDRKGRALTQDQLTRFRGYVARLTPSEWVRRANQKKVVVQKRAGARANYSGHEWPDPIITVDGSDGADVYVHEYAHHLERMLPELYLLERDFLTNRLAPGEQVQQIYPGRPKEKGYRDELNLKYSGRQYPDSYAEIMSEGFENLFWDRKNVATHGSRMGQVWSLFADDPDYAAFLLGLLTGGVRGHDSTSRVATPGGSAPGADAPLLRVATGIDGAAEAVMRHVAQTDPSATPEKVAEGVGNWRTIFRGRVENDAARVRAYETAIEQNAADPYWRAAVGRYGEVPVVGIRSGARPDRAQLIVREDDSAAGRYLEGNATILLFDPLEPRGRPDGRRPAALPFEFGTPALIRHEYGHHVWYGLSQEQRDEFNRLLPPPTTRDEFNARDSISYYAGLHADHFNGNRVRPDQEAFAEAFALATEPTYEPDRYPQAVQDAVQWIRSAVIGAG